MNRFEFPEWVNTIRLPLLVFLGLGGLYTAGVVAFGAAPGTHNVGYMPDQPVYFSHKIHAGQLKMDCRYCHNTVDRAAFAAIPPTKTCLNCHSGADANGVVATTAVHTNSNLLLPVRESAATGLPIRWKKIHDLPDYVYFNHSAHVTRGVSCVSCHGRIDKMEVVYQEEILTMGWCLKCHRNPDEHLRPPELVTKFDWVPPEDPETIGKRIREELNINPPTNCSTCHR